MPPTARTRSPRRSPATWAPRWRNERGDGALRELSFGEALREALDIAPGQDPRVVLMGEDIGVYGGTFPVTGDLGRKYGPDRVMDTPISEPGGDGVAAGAALTGLRPIYEFQFSGFATLAMEQIVNQAAKLRFMLGGTVSVPLVMRFAAGFGSGAAAQHLQGLEAWLSHVPGRKVVQPTPPEDAKGLLLAAPEVPDRAMIFEHKMLHKMKGPVTEGHYTTPIGRAAIRRAGRDMTIVAGGHGAQGAGGRGHAGRRGDRGRGDRPAQRPAARPRYDPGQPAAHGFAADSLSSAPLKAHLGQRPLFRIDLPGHCLSASRGAVVVAALASLLCAAFDDLGMGRAHLVGHSLGGRGRSRWPTRGPGGSRR